MATILTLDKDPLQLELLSVLLKRDRHVSISTADPDNAIALLENQDIDLVILETAFPRHDGYRLCQQIRKDREELPIIILSERTGDEQIVRGLLSGADDYITKPYSPRELLARIHAVMRRTEPALGRPSNAGNLRIGELTLNLQQMQLLINGRAVSLTPRELALINALMSNPKRVLSRDQLMRIAWGNSFVGCLKTVDVCVQRLRKKISPHLQHGAYIHAARGFGYRFESPDLEPALMRPRPATTTLLPEVEGGVSPRHEQSNVDSLQIIQPAAASGSGSSRHLSLTTVSLPTGDQPLPIRNGNH